jgi:hypothetical protein
LHDVSWAVPHQDLEVGRELSLLCISIGRVVQHQRGGESLSIPLVEPKLDVLPILALYRPPPRPVERLAARKASANLAPERLLEPHHSGLGDKLWLHTRGKAVGVTFASEAGQTLVMMIPSPLEIY